MDLSTWGEEKEERTGRKERGAHGKETWHLPARGKVVFSQRWNESLYLLQQFLSWTKRSGKTHRTSPEAALMETEVKSLWAATRVSIKDVEKKEEESAIQHAEREVSLKGCTATVTAMEEGLEQAVMNRAQIQWPLWSGHMSQVKECPLSKTHDLFARTLLKGILKWRRDISATCSFPDLSREDVSLPQTSLQRYSG